MNNIPQSTLAPVPWHHIDALAHGDCPFIIESFARWLLEMKEQGVRAVVLPVLAKSDKRHYGLALAMLSLRSLVVENGLVVLRWKQVR